MRRFLFAGLLLTLGGAAGVAVAADRTLLQLPGLEIHTVSGSTAPTALAVQVLLALTVLSLAPAILISMSAFVRTVIVLSMLRHALGMQETPPNTVLISLALFLTFFTMSPVLDQMNTRAVEPYLAKQLSLSEAYERGSAPLREFMLRQTREQDLALMVELAGAPAPRTVDEVKMVQLIPAFVLNELRTAFQIGFVIFLPFLLIDLIVSSVLMGLGMMMVPPAMIALPLKVLMFVLIDGWNLVVRALVTSFH